MPSENPRLVPFKNAQSDPGQQPESLICDTGSVRTSQHYLIPNSRATTGDVFDLFYPCGDYTVQGTKCIINYLYEILSLVLKFLGE